MQKFFPFNLYITELNIKYKEYKPFLVTTKNNFHIEFDHAKTIQYDISFSISVRVKLGTINYSLTMYKQRKTHQIDF